MGSTKQLRHLLRDLVTKTLWAILQCRLALAYRLWGIEGVNRVLLLCNSAYVGYILARFGAILGSGHSVHSPLLIQNADRNYSNLAIGENCHLGKEVFLDLRDGIAIENNVTVSMRAMILTHTDVGRSPLGNGAFPARQSPVVIKKGAYIGAGAIVLQGVTVGECAVVGAGAVITEDIPGYSVAVGIPARVVRCVRTEDGIPDGSAPK